MPDRTYQPCPAWCTRDHAEEARRQAQSDQRVLRRPEHAALPPAELDDLRVQLVAMRARIHNREVARFPNSDADEIVVGVYKFEGDGEVEGPSVYVDRAELMPPALANRVAEAIVEAARIAAS